MSALTKTAWENTLKRYTDKYDDSTECRLAAVLAQIIFEVDDPKLDRILDRYALELLEQR